jgi:hypothetical protein
VFLPPSIKELLDPKEKRSFPLYATYLVDLPKRLDVRHVIYDEGGFEKVSSTTRLTQSRASMYLKFPQKVISMV